MRVIEPMDQASTARTLQWIAITALLLLLVYAAIDIMLLVFAGVLLAIPLRELSRAIAERTGLAIGWALAGVLLCGALLIGLASWYLAPEVARQSRDLIDQAPRSWDGVQQRLDTIVGDDVTDQIRQKFGSVDRNAIGSLLPKAFGVFSGVTGAIASGVVVLFVGLYVAAEPQPYYKGIVRLVPPPYRNRTQDVLCEMRDTLLWWLIGKFCSMAVVGVLTFLGLWFLNVPLALALALLAGVLTFIPNFGPILAAAPAILLALGDGVSQATWVTALYVAVQTVESYFITPLIQQQTLSLPPALTITMQLIVGGLTGVVGLAVATPLTAAAVVLVRKLYVEDLLEASVEAGDTSLDESMKAIGAHKRYD